jgi:signal peptidase I
MPSHDPAPLDLRQRVGFFPPVSDPDKPAMSQPSEIPAAASKARAKPAKKEEAWLELTKTIVYALLIALVIRTFLFQPFNIPSGSMKSTLLVGDYVFVEKFAYGYSRYSFPWGLGPFSGRIFGSMPRRGDVVVFKDPPKPSEDFIKRVVGLPGDRIQMRDGVLYVNGKAVPKIHVQDWFGFADCDPNEDDSPCPLGATPTYNAQFRETLPGGKSYLVLDSNTSVPQRTTGQFIVPPDHYFMMGDNRDNSNDSRLEVGFVPAQNLVGRAVFRFFSTDGSILEVWNWRFDRMFTGID